MRLTTNRLAALACPAGKRDALFFDDEQRGLGVRVTAGGSKTYLCQYTIAGTKRRVPLGSCRAITLAQAREAAKVIMGDVAKGVDPASVRKEAAAAARRRDAEEALTLNRLIDDWSRLHLVSKRPNYSEAAVRVLRNVFAEQMDMPAATLDRSTVVQVADGLAARDRKSIAAAAVAYGRACYGWARKRGSVNINPFERVPTSATVPRERVLSDAEIASIWRATTAPSAFNSIVRVLLLTGQRRNEVAGMEWAEVELCASGWTIAGARSKNGVPHMVPIAQAVASIIEAQRRVGPLVFQGERGLYSGWSKSKRALDTRSGMSDWVLHDLRRTAATGMQRLGVRFEVIEHVLNHLSGSRGGLGAVYRRHEFEQEKRAALEAWARHVLAVVDGREDGGNVIGFAAAR